jgi:hypothetical protein
MGKMKKPYVKRCTAVMAVLVVLVVLVVLSVLLYIALRGRNVSESFRSLEVLKNIREACKENPSLKSCSEIDVCKKSFGPHIHWYEDDEGAEYDDAKMRAKLI